MDEEEDVYKRSGGRRDSVDESVKTIRKEVDAHNARVAAVAEKLDDPIYLGGLMLAVHEEKKSTNMILKNLKRDIESVKALSKRVAKLEVAVEAGRQPAETKPAEPQMPLPEADERIMALVRKQGKVCAADVQQKFGYRGKNAASARLNGLYVRGVLGKKSAGRTVYYYEKSHG